MGKNPCCGLILFKILASTENSDLVALFFVLSLVQFCVGLAVLDFLNDCIII